MASENLDIIIRADSSDAERDIGKVEGKMSSLGKMAGVAAAGVAAGAVAFGVFAKKAIDAAASLEQQEVAFKTLLGTQEKANTFLKEAKDLAARTPFETKDITQAAQTMLAFGASVESVIPNIKMIGDVALGNKEKFSSLALSFSQVQAAGKLTGGDLLQMVNQGFNPLQIMAEKSGKSMAVLRDEMEKGKISAQMVTEAFKTATSEGGRFAGGMEAQATTFTGLVSTLSDAWNTFLEGQGKRLIEWGKEIVILLTGFIQNVLPVIVEKLDAVIKKIAEFMPSGKGLMEFFGNLGTTISNLARKFEEKTGLVGQLKDAFGRLWATVQETLVPALQKLWVAMQPLMPYLQALAVLVATVLVITLKVLIEVLVVIIDSFIRFISKVIEIAANIQEFLNPAVEVATKVFNKMADAIQWVIDKFNAMKAAAQAAMTFAQNAINAVPGGRIADAILPGRASGGPVTGGEAYMVGERGPEMFVPRSSGSIVPNDALGGATQIHIMEGASVSVGSQGDINALADAVSTRLARVLQQQRNGLATSM